MNNSLLQNISAEFRLLISCLKYYTGTASGKELIAFSEVSIKTRKFLWLVHEHRLSFVIHYCIREVPGAFSEKIKKGIDHEHKANVAFMMQLGKEMLKLNRLALKNKLQLSFIKGPVLAERLYGGAFNTRKSRDLDILVQEQNLAPLHALLLQQGYRLMSSDEKTEASNNTNWLAYQRKTNHHLVYHSPSKLTIELHWSLTRNPAIDAFAFTTHKMAGQKLRVLASENAALYLSWHGGSHRWKRLFWLLDIAMLIRREIITEEVIELARQRKINRSLISACMLVHELLGLQLPGHILQEYQEDRKAVDDLNRRIINMMFRKDILHQQKLSIKSLRLLLKIFRDEKLTGLKLYQGAAEKWKFINSLFYSPANQSYIPLPRGLFFLYIPLRPFILLMMWRDKVKVTKQE